MKKILLFSLVILASAAQAGVFSKRSETQKPYFAALTAGYVFKNDCEFKEVYGHGMINALTADFCYYFLKHWGFGAKLSYWRAKGETSFLKQCAIAQEVPVTVYFRAMKELECRLQLYGSLGGGFAWIKDKSYLGSETIYKGLGELEMGLNYPIWRCVNLTGAFRYLFPQQEQECGCEKKDVGGFDLRAGLGFTF